MSTNRFTVAEWRAFCAQEWPALAARADALTTKALEPDPDSDVACLIRLLQRQGLFTPTRSRGFGRRAR